MSPASNLNRPVSLILLITVTAFSQYNKYDVLDMRIGTNFTIFLVLFSVAVVEAAQTKNWYIVSLFLAFSLVFLYADTKSN